MIRATPRARSARGESGNTSCLIGISIMVSLSSCCVIAVSNKNNTWLYGKQQLQCKDICWLRYIKEVTKAKGRTAKHKLFPNPVGSTAKISLPDKIGSSLPTVQALVMDSPTLGQLHLLSAVHWIVSP